jgi:hypothetical protein
VETPLRSPDRDQATVVHHEPTPTGLIPILLQEAIITQEEAMVPLDHHIRVVDVPHMVHHPEALVVEAEAVLEAGNIELKFNDDEKVHPSCSHVVFILIGNACAVHG